ANLPAAVFPEWRVLGIFPHASRTPELASDQRGAVALRHSFRQARPSAGGATVPARRDIVARRYHGRHVALPLFRTGDRAALIAAGRALVPHATRARAIPRARHDPVRGVARAAGLLTDDSINDEIAVRRTERQKAGAENGFHGG